MLRKDILLTKLTTGISRCNSIESSVIVTPYTRSKFHYASLSGIEYQRCSLNSFLEVLDMNVTVQIQPGSKQPNSQW